MVEIVLHRVPEAAMLEHAGRITGNILDSVKGAIFHAISEEGATPEEVYDAVMSKPEFSPKEVAPHQFFIAVCEMLNCKFISAEIRQIGAA